MSHRHKLTGRILRLTEEPANGIGRFEDGSTVVRCDMRYITETHEVLPELPAYSPEYYRALIPKKPGDHVVQISSVSVTS